MIALTDAPAPDLSSGRSSLSSQQDDASRLLLLTETNASQQRMGKSKTGGGGQKLSACCSHAYNPQLKEMNREANLYVDCCFVRHWIGAW